MSRYCLILIIITTRHLYNTFSLELRKERRKKYTVLLAVRELDIIYPYIVFEIKEVTHLNRRHRRCMKIDKNYGLTKCLQQ